MPETCNARSLGWEDSREKGMAKHFRILPRGISWAEEPGKESDATECLTFQFLSKQLRATDKVLEILLCRRGVFLRNWARDERDERNPFLFPSSWLSSRLPLTPLLGGAWGQQKSASDSPGSTLCTPPPLDRWSGNKVLLPKRLVNTEELLGEF